MARNPKQDANLKEPFDSNQSREEASKNGRKGGKKSGEVRRAKRDAREAARYILGLKPNENLQKNAENVGAEKKDGITNLEVLFARLFALAMGGNLDAYEKLMKSAGYDYEENRKERESLASDKRRDLEVEAKVHALGSNPDSKVSMNFGDEEGNGGVMIYLPEMENEESCEVDEPDEEIIEQNGDDNG